MLFPSCRSCLANARHHITRALFGPTAHRAHTRTIYYYALPFMPWQPNTTEHTVATYAAILACLLAYYMRPSCYW